MVLLWEIFKLASHCVHSGFRSYFTEYCTKYRPPLSSSDAFLTTPVAQLTCKTKSLRAIDYRQLMSEMVPFILHRIYQSAVLISNFRRFLLKTYTRTNLSFCYFPFPISCRCSSLINIRRRMTTACPLRCVAQQRLERMQKLLSDFKMWDILDPVQFLA